MDYDANVLILKETVSASVQYLITVEQIPELSLAPLSSSTASTRFPALTLVLTPPAFHSAVASADNKLMADSSGVSMDYSVKVLDSGSLGFQSGIALYQSFASMLQSSLSSGNFTSILRTMAAGGPLSSAVASADLRISEPTITPVAGDDDSNGDKHGGLSRSERIGIIVGCSLFVFFGIYGFIYWNKKRHVAVADVAHGTSVVPLPA
jgi:hypothetical protein